MKISMQRLLVLLLLITSAISPMASAQDSPADILRKLNSVPQRSAARPISPSAGGSSVVPALVQPFYRQPRLIEAFQTGIHPKSQMSPNSIYECIYCT